MFEFSRLFGFQVLNFILLIVQSNGFHNYIFKTYSIELCSSLILIHPYHLSLLSLDPSIFHLAMPMSSHQRHLV